ncbi:phosphoglycerate kinase [Serpentinicella sp. ANB-PHB4]|uniref:phosphoglycerate kinase n=1 Tax=Serpentinicella sp. ANB-PHB4 TaxID=3074076 RepID=UPI00285CC9DB|nr:phosphoglycerate kinase [Serpentinicella sp. ANB-PHB4]MDR5658972.1 phosphoglycerate kinase [Serpentinicella sp. ANB-PHB4]
MKTFNKKTVENIDVNNKKVLVRCDFNVPMQDNKNITDDRRIRAALPTIEHLLEKGASIILMSHLGRPKGEAKKEFSLEPVSERLSQLLDKSVIFSDDDEVLGNKTKLIAKDLKPGQILLLQNMRFRKEEEENDTDFSKELASLGDIYINDAFGTAHRAHSSTAGIADFLPSAMGYLIAREVKVIDEVLNAPQRPLVAILGGAKVSDKIGVIENLLNTVDTLLIGGGMAYTFIKGMGYEVGQSLLEEDKIDLAKELIIKSKEHNVELLLPIDVVVAEKFDASAKHYITSIKDIPKDMMGLDIGEKTRKLFEEKISSASTVIWNGPMGVFEMPAFAKGTEAVAASMAKSNAKTIIGGGDSAAAAEMLGYSDKMNYILTGGGASLELLEGKMLPGIEAIENI